MRFNPLYFPLLTFLLTTLSLVQVHPTAALQFPFSLPVALVGFFRHHSTESHTDNINLDDFWQRARELGEKAQNYGEDLMKIAAERSQEVSTAVTEVKEHIRTIVRGATEWHEELNALNILRTRQSQENTTATVVSLDHIAADLEVVFGRVLEELQIMFPPPDHALGHEGRAAVVGAALDKAGEALVTVCGKYGMDEDRVRVHYSVVRPPIHTAVLLIGDLAEQHPDLVEGILFFAAVAIIPSFLRPLLTVFGFGPTGPIKGSTAAWAQRVFYGAAVNKGSWFAKLQQAAMSSKSWWQRWLEWLGWA